MYQDLILHAGLIAGYAIIFAIIFAESGILIGFFFPGDSLLFSLGLLASQGYLNIFLILILGSIAAITGDSVGYAFGRKIGPALFNKKDSIFFKKEYLEKAQAFYEEHGKKTIVLARFTPIVRTFAPIVAGIGKMDYSTFITYNMIGGVSWIFSITLLGYFLGNIIPKNEIEKYSIIIVVVIVVVSIGLPLLHVRKAKKNKTNA